MALFMQSFHGSGKIIFIFVLCFLFFCFLYHFFFFSVNLFNDIYLDSSPFNDATSYQQAVFPFYPPKYMRKGETFLSKIYVKNNQLRACPFIDYGPTENQDRVYIRETSQLNLLLMQNYNIINFFKTVVKNEQFNDVMDCTNLLIYSKKSKPILNLIDVAVKNMFKDVTDAINAEKKKKFNESLASNKEKKLDISNENLTNDDSLSDSNLSPKSDLFFQTEYTPRVVVCSNFPVIRHIADYAVTLKDGKKNFLYLI